MHHWDIKKRQVTTKRGLVASQHYEASEAGAAVLRAGGNAMDAAVVTALALSVVEPWLSGIGGGGFLLWADGAGKSVDTLDFNVRAGRELNPADYPLAGGSDSDWFGWPKVQGNRNIVGYSSICVPGAIAGFAEALNKYGTISWEDAVQPVAELAERGMRVDWFASLCFAIDRGNLAEYRRSAELFLEHEKPTGANTSEYLLPMPEKAALLRRLAKAGARDFYEGEIAGQLVEDLKAGGAPVSAADMRDYEAVWKKPGTTDYRGFEVNVPPEFCGGPSLLSTLDYLSEELDIEGDAASAAVIYARAIRRSYEERLKTMGHAGRIGQDCTSHVSVVDADGNMVSLTNTLLSRFGSKVTLEKSGILMNNGLMWFDPRPDKPNSIAPGVRPLANMSPTLLRQNGKPSMAVGAAGGRQIFPAIAQIISYVVDKGMTLEDAFNSPRIDASTPTITVDVAAEDTVAATVAEEFPIRIMPNGLHPINYAIPSAVMLDPTGNGNIGMVHSASPWTACIPED
ncbi:gamma-glutamyltransferase family protein [Oricola indica]|uniref:gamma-glutamyltransferase family protein n=1 Tax=Oricola indica TaxID=2872591 RepID=UPI003CCBF102